MRSGRLRSPSSVCQKATAFAAAGRASRNRLQPEWSPSAKRSQVRRVSGAAASTASRRASAAARSASGRNRRQELAQPGGLEQGVVGRRHQERHAERRAAPPPPWRSARPARSASSRAAWRSAAAAGRQIGEQLRPLDRDDDALDLRHGGERLDDALDHGPAADLDQRLVADAGVLGERVAAGARAGQHQRGQAGHWCTPRPSAGPAERERAPSGGRRGSRRQRLLVDAVGLVGDAAERLDHVPHRPVVLEDPRQLDLLARPFRCSALRTAFDDEQRREPADQAAAGSCAGCPSAARARCARRASSARAA